MRVVALEHYPELDFTFWESLRALATTQAAGNVAFVLAASVPPDQLASRSGMGSPFFNIFGYTVRLRPLLEREARALIASAPLPFAPADVEWMLSESGRSVRVDAGLFCCKSSVVSVFLLLKKV